MKYTYDWNAEFKLTTANIKNLELCLEIGCFEGLTSNYIIENLLSENGKLYCVDPLTDNYLNTDLTDVDIQNNTTIYSYFNEQYNRFIDNVKTHINSGKLILHRDLSEKILPKLIETQKNSFDLIYVDGDHRASAVYRDAIYSYELCKIGGLIIFDDYSWGESYGEESTSKGIDKFLKEYSDKIEITKKAYQVAVRKK